MSEIANYKKISLGETEQLFIFLFAQRSSSAYHLCHSTMSHIKPMSYKNVFTKIQRLVELGLIEPVKGKFKRRAIKYQLTTRGLFERLTLTSWYEINPRIWYDYKDNIILQTLLYPFFEIETILSAIRNKFSVLSILIDDYIRKCCEGILLLAKSKSEAKNENDIKLLLKNELRVLILKLITTSGIEQIYWENEHRISPNQEIYGTLRRDKKFFAYVLEMKDDLVRGYPRFGIALG